MKWKEARHRHTFIKAINHITSLEVPKLKDSSPQIHIHIQTMEEREERVVAPSRFARTNQIAPTQVSFSSFFFFSIKTHSYFSYIFFLSKESRKSNSDETHFFFHEHNGKTFFFFLNTINNERNLACFEGLEQF